MLVDDVVTLGSPISALVADMGFNKEVKEVAQDMERQDYDAMILAGDMAYNGWQVFMDYTQSVLCNPSRLSVADGWRLVGYCRDAECGRDRAPSTALQQNAVFGVPRQP